MDQAGNGAPVCRGLEQTSRRGFNYAALGSCLFALTVVGFLVVFVRDQEQRLVLPNDVAANLDEQGKLRPLIELASTTRSLRLETIVIESSVTAEAEDESWRGTTKAMVEVPVRYRYGVDLSGVKNSSFAYLPTSRIFYVTIPKPTRTIEVVGDKPIREVVEPGWLRLKSMSGREQLLVAHKKAFDEARRKALPREKLAAIEADTLQEVEQLVKKLVGAEDRVEVRYER